MDSSRKKDKIIVYEPHSMSKAGIRIWAHMLRELLASRELIWRLVVRDISARYKQSILGVVWAVLTPLAMMLAFVWIKNKNIFTVADTAIPYAAYVFYGQMIWLLFSHGVTTAANSLVGAGSLLTKINFPKESLVFSALGQTLFEFLIRIPLLLLIFFWVGFVPKATILLMPVVLAPLLLMVLGIGFFVALFNAMVRDTGSMLGIVMSLGIFVTPVIYPRPTQWPLSFVINYVNPVSGFINAAQDLLSVGYLTDPLSYGTAVLISMLLFFIGWRTFHLVEPKIAERI